MILYRSLQTVFIHCGKIKKVYQQEVYRCGSADRICGNVLAVSCADRGILFLYVPPAEEAGKGTRGIFAGAEEGRPRRDGRRHSRGGEGAS